MDKGELGSDALCTECGSEGPHTVVDNDGKFLTMECGSCHDEFDVSLDKESNE